MFGWLSFPASEASLRKSFSKRLASSSLMSAPLLATLTATLRSLNGSSARNTTAEAPWPSSDRTLYFPILVGRSNTAPSLAVFGAGTGSAQQLAGGAQEPRARDVVDG